MASIRPAPASAAVASVAAAPSNAPKSGEAEADSNPLSVLTAFAAPIVPASISGAPANAALDPLIHKYSTHYGVPEGLVRRVIVRESKYNPSARNGPYYGLMQISHATARGMGYRGSASGLLDAETNLRYAVRYLAGAYVTAGGNHDRAMQFYARGYYYDAKKLGLLDQSGLR